MSHALQIDTLAFSKRLKEAGADEALADAIVEGLTAADTSELATKADLAEVQAAMKADVAAVESALKADVAAVESALKADVAVVESKLAEVKNELKGDIAEVKIELAEVKAEIAHATNRAIYTLGGLVGVLFIIDRIIPLMGIGN
ncbi:hypothetical protein [Ruegeria sp.]|uniref:hypothetical protein n=1 Tax=Ruegeria sp. TaxID=1879320 RepID=UPI003AFF8817